MCEPAPGEATLDELSPSEHLVVFAWRMLVAGRRHCPALRDELEACAEDDAPKVLAGLSAVLLAVGRGSRKPISVGHPGCAVVTKDERDLLSLLSAAQTGDESLLAARLCWMVRLECQLAAAAIVQSFAITMDAVGLRLPCPEIGAERPSIPRLALC